LADNERALVHFVGFPPSLDVEIDMTAIASRGVLTDWLVMCSQNGNSIAAPDNIIADGEINLFI
jgi:hypothetical protein